MFDEIIASMHTDSKRGAKYKRYAAFAIHLAQNLCTWIKALNSPSARAANRPWAANAAGL
jgi:hypothetical protein